MDTIFALSTAQGRAGVAVIRISGPLAHDALTYFGCAVPPKRRATLAVLRDATGEMIDQALILCFDEKKSFTGEKILEIQCHGSQAVTQRLLSELSDFSGFRPAEPGEFTRRALENGVLDLSQVEGLADLIEAETEAQRRQALRVLAGDLTRRVESWRSRLIRAIALLEATIDFADEEVPEDVSPEVIDLLKRVTEDLKDEVTGYAAAERIRSGFEVAIVGSPNVGKSTLLNALAGRDAAITSAQAGTTRDVIEVRMDLKGLPVTILDTAGLRNTTDEIEGLGINRAIERASSADMRVFLLEPGEEPGLSPSPGDLLLLAKADLHGEVENAVSGRTGFGVDEMTDQIVAQLGKQTASAGLAVRERHRSAMQDALSHIRTAQSMVESGDSEPEMMSEELRYAIRRLDSVIGRFDIENVLDEIFASFCLGK